jgi:hypothetical protein
LKAGLEDSLKPELGGCPSLFSPKKSIASAKHMAIARPLKRAIAIIMVGIN